MQDMRLHLEKLRADACECALIRDLATDHQKRELFTRLAAHLDVLALEVERAMVAREMEAQHMELRVMVFFIGRHRYTWQVHDCADALIARGKANSFAEAQKAGEKAANN